MNRAALRPVSLEKAMVLRSDVGNFLYPIIDNIIIMSPISRQLRSMCNTFFKENSGAIAKLGIDPDPPKLTERLLAFMEKKELAWLEEEMTFWEDKFRVALRGHGQYRLGWNRTIPRERIIADLKNEIASGVVLEIGCGGSCTLSEIFKGSLSLYYGLDLSYYACQLSRRAFPQGIFIQSAIVPLPFREESVDFLIAYGVFHHLPGHEANISKVLPVLRKGGYLIGSDPLPGFSRGVSKEKTSDMQQASSPHNDSIDWPNMVAIAKNQTVVVRVRKEYGLLRALLVMILYDRLGVRGKLFTRLVIWLDHLWLLTIGKISSRLGPRGILYLLQKRGENM